MEGVFEFSGGAVAGGVEVSSGVVDGAGEDVEIVVEAVEFVSGDDQLVLPELEFGGSLARHPVPLTAALTAELLRSAWARAGRQHPTTPAAAGDRSPGVVDRA